MIILVEMTKRLAKVIVRVSATGCRMWPEIKMPAFPLPFFEREREKEREREREREEKKDGLFKERRAIASIFGSCNIFKNTGISWVMLSNMSNAPNPVLVSMGMAEVHQPNTSPRTTSHTSRAGAMLSKYSMFSQRMFDVFARPHHTNYVLTMGRSACACGSGR